MSAEAGETGLAQAGSKIQFHESIEFGVRFFNLNTKVFEMLTLRASVIENLRIDLILGLQTVGKHNLLPKLTTLCGSCTPRVGGCSAPLIGGECTPLGGAAQKAGRA